MSYRERNLNALWVLLGINVLMFVAVYARPDLVWTLGLQPGSVLARPWTIVTSIFVHEDIWHILANMVTLYFFGSSLCRLLGTKWFLITYFGAGLLGSLFYILMGPATSVAIGASGAIFGLGGVMTVLAPKMRVMVFPIPVPMPLWVAIIGGFVIISFLPGIAWQAHLGGLVAGLLCGYYFRKKGRFNFG
jgi:uncharacterized protein